MRDIFSEKLIAWPNGKSGHSTPGCGEYAHIETGSGKVIVDGAWYGSIDEGYVNLFAAAPEMYAMLLKAKNTLLKTYDATEWPADGKTHCDKVAREIDDLLAKAGGEQK